MPSQMCTTYFRTISYNWFWRIFSHPVTELNFLGMRLFLLSVVLGLTLFYLLYAFIASHEDKEEGPSNTQATLLGPVNIQSNRYIYIFLFSLFTHSFRSFRSSPVI